MRAITASTHPSRRQRPAGPEALREHVAMHGEQRYAIVADPSEFARGDLEAAVGEGIVENVEVADFTVIADTDA